MKDGLTWTLIAVVACGTILWIIAIAMAISYVSNLTK
jgi:hypothetical protein